MTKQPGAAIVQRGSRPHSQVVIVPPPELPVMPTCFGSTSGRDEQVVERADAVPGPPAAEELADEELLVAGVEMLADADARPMLRFSTWPYCSRSPWPIGSKISTT